MNAKNIILAILMVLSFAACSSEIEGIDDTMPNTSANNANGTTSISVRMTTGDMNTKSASTTEEGEEMGTIIKSYIIAVFEHGSKERVGYATSTSEINVSSITIDNIDTKEGEVDIIAVANVDVNDFNSLYTYDDFANHIVKDNLIDSVKVGTASTTLVKGRANSIGIELVQLTALVNVQLTTEVIMIGDTTKNVEVSFMATSYSNRIATGSTILNPTTSVANAENFKGAEHNTAGVNANSFSYITYAVNQPELTVTTNLSVTVDGQVVKTDNGKNITVQFIEKSNLLSCLENGNIYTQEIKVKVTVSSSADVKPTFTYEVAPIREIENEITFN